MTNPTQLCPYCGAANLTAALHCGTCGRPLAAAPPAAGGGPAKTMFGYAAPMIRPNAPGTPPPVDQGAPTIVQDAQPDPTQYAPPAQPQYAPPAQPQYAPPAQPQYAPPAQPQYAAPPATIAPQYMPPPAQPQFAPPAQPQYAPPAQPQYAAAPPAQPPTPGYLAPPPAHDPLGHLAGRVPQSAPGTLFGFPISRLREPALQRRALFLAGVALAISAVVPFSLRPLLFPWSGNAFYGFLWPLIAGASYLLVAAAPPHIRQKVPPAVLHWLPFGVAFLGTFFSGLGISAMFGGMGSMFAGGFGGSGYFLGYTILCFGLLSRLARPDDKTARIVIGVGSVLLLFPFLGSLSHLQFHGGIMFILMQLLMLVVLALGVACVVFVIPPKHLPPALQAADALAPLVTAVMLLWIPLQLVLIALALLTGLGGLGGGGIVMMVLCLAHGLLAALSYFGVLMMTAPAAYEEGMGLFHKINAEAGGPPPQQ